MRADDTCPACQQPVRHATWADTHQPVALNPEPTTDPTAPELVGYLNGNPVITHPDQAKQPRPRGLNYQPHTCPTTINQP
jgi:hypothetical protein